MITGGVSMFLCLKSLCDWSKSGEEIFGNWPEKGSDFA